MLQPAEQEEVQNLPKTHAGSHIESKYAYKGGELVAVPGQKDGAFLTAVGGSQQDYVLVSYLSPPG